MFCVCFNVLVQRTLQKCCNGFSCSTQCVTHPIVIAQGVFELASLTLHGAVTGPLCTSVSISLAPSGLCLHLHSYSKLSFLRRPPMPQTLLPFPVTVLGFLRYSVSICRTLCCICSLSVSMCFLYAVHGICPELVLSCFMYFPAHLPVLL